MIKYLLHAIPRPTLIRLSLKFNWIFKIFLSGKEVECPVCKNTYSRFLAYGYGETPRPNALCPGCLSLERHRNIWLYLQRETDFFTAKLKMLHIAPEQSFHSRFKKMKNLDYVTADLESPLADIHCDVMALPMEDNTFDVVMCNHVLEHVESDHKALTEIYRVLKPGGWAILQVPVGESLDATIEDPTITDPEERIRLFGQYDHVRMYARDFPERLHKAGFIPIEWLHTEHLSPEEEAKYKIPPNEILYGGQKA